MTNDERLARFKEIRRVLCEKEGDYARLAEALPVVQQWFDRRGVDVRVSLQATQILLADGERRSPAIAAAEQPLDEVLARFDSVGLQLQKCFVLACWEPDVSTRDARRVLALAASPWWWTERPQDAAWRWIEPLLQKCNEVADRPPVTFSNPSLPPPFDKAGVDQRLTQAATNTAANHGNAGAFAAPLSEVTTAIQACISFSQTFAPQITRELSTQIDPQVGTLTSRNALLWWSHARYCRRYERPLRVLANDATKRWWAAYELAREVPSELVEPACSMLVETLVDLGVSFDTRRTLREWLDELHGVLRHDEEVPALVSSFSSHVARCAVGLPVSRLRLNRTAPFDAVALTEATTLDLDAEITSWQWSSWLLRECMLERAFG